MNSILGVRKVFVFKKILLFYFITFQSLYATTCHQGRYCVTPAPPAPRVGIMGKDNQNYDLFIPKPEQILTVGDLLEIALYNNPATHKAWTDALVSYFGWGISRSILYPTIAATETLQASDISVGVSATGVGATVVSNVATDNVNAVAANTGTNQISGGFAPGANQSLTSDLLISYLVFDFGGRCASIAAARQAWYSSYWLYNQSTQTVLLNVLQSYYQYASTKALIIAQLSNLKNAQTTYNSANAQFQAGVKTHVDVLLAKSALVNSELGLVQLEGELKVNLGTLDRTLGISPSTPLKVQEFPFDIPTQEQALVLNDLMETALCCRPDLASTDALYSEKKANYVATVSNSLPTLTANGVVQYTKFLNSQASAFSGHAVLGTLQLNVPIFTGYSHTNQIRQANQEVNSAFYAVEDMEMQVLLDVVTAYHNFNTSLETVKYSKEYLKSTEESYNAISEGYKQGTSNILDLLAAQSSLASARAQFVQARTNWSVALANLAYATGTLSVSGVP